MEKNNNLIIMKKKYLFGILLAGIFFLLGWFLFAIIILSICIISVPSINQKLFEKKSPHERNLFGKICKYSWIGFNVLFFISIIFYVISIIYGFINGSYVFNIEIDPSLGIGVMISVVFFIVTFLIGNFVLGIMTFLTRPKK